MQFVTQEAGKARKTNALMYNPTTNRYSIITNYNPEIQGAKGIDIDPSRVEQIKADIKASIERNIPWAVSNTYLSNVGKVVSSAKPQNQRHTQDEIDTAYNKLLDDEKAQVSAYINTGKTKEEALEVMNKLKQGGKID